MAYLGALAVSRVMDRNTASLDARSLADGGGIRSHEPLTLASDEDAPLSTTALRDETASALICLQRSNQ